MGNVITDKIMGMGRAILACLALLLLAATTLIMPNGAEASVAALNAWPVTPQIVSNAATGTVTGTVTVGAGSNRVMLVAVGAEYTAAPATLPIKVTFGGQPVYELEKSFSGPNVIWLGFIGEAGLAKASGATLSVTNGTTTNLTAMYASAAVYSGVDQTNPISGTNKVSSGATAVTAMNMPLFSVKGAAGNTALSVYVSNRNLQASTPDAAYTENVEYLGTNFYLAFNTIITAPAALVSTAPVVTTATASLGSAIGVGLVPAGVTVGTISSCSKCHWYPPADGTARNNPAGEFPGSHNKHAGTAASQYAFLCTRCHTDSTTFDHENGTIDMASPINGNAGASYSKGASFAVTNNALTGGTCSGTYCHSNGTGGTLQTGDTRGIVANTSLTWGAAGGNNFAANCSTTCHNGRPSYANYTSATSVSGKKANSHQATTHSQQTCDACHNSVATADSGATYSTYTTHNNGRYNLKTSLGYTFGVRGGTCSTPGCHGTATWGRTLSCVNCHNTTITRTLGRPGTTLSAVAGEFGLAYGHKKSGRGAVTAADCIVCHLEGYGFGSANAGSINPTYHKNGNIDLRDPAGSGETPITNISGGAFTFQRFSTSYAAGSRTTTGHQSNTDIANVITQKFCLACHRSSGATNPTARTAGGTAYMPWGGVNLGTNYTVANGASVAGGVVNVFSQFSSGNSSYHPVRGPLNRDFPLATRLSAPYNNQAAGRVATGATKSLSVVINCFDCHNASAPLTTRTISAHGNAAMIRGTDYSAQPLCTICHTGYTVTGTHGSGSAWSATGSDHNASQNCHYCHGSNTSTTAPARPRPAQDYHGNNSLNGGGLWPTVNSRPYAFIRGWTGTAYHRPFRAKEFTTGNATCASGTCPGGGQVGDGSTRTYTPGGSY